MARQLAMTTTSASFRVVSHPDDGRASIWRALGTARDSSVKPTARSQPTNILKTVADAGMGGNDGAGFHDESDPEAESESDENEGTLRVSFTATHDFDLLRCQRVSDSSEESRVISV